MSLSRRLLLVVAFLIAAVAVSYWLHKSRDTPPSLATSGSNLSTAQATAPTVSRSVPSKSTDANEQPPDVTRKPEKRSTQVEDAATITVCHEALLQKKTVQQRQDNNCGKIPSEDTVRYQICRNALEVNFALLQELEAKTAACPESLANASNYYEALRDAALAGDADAQRCFLVAFNGPNSAGGIGQTQVDEYLSLAKQFIQSAFERGDWEVVHRLGEWRGGHPDLLMQAYPYGSEHPDTLYRMNYLITLGSKGGKGADDERNVVSGIRHKGELSAEQVQAAEAWARETYDRYFAATPYDKNVAARPLCKES